MRYFILILLLMPVLSFAQAGGELLVGEQAVVYDRSTTTDAGELYFRADTLVASEHEGLTLVYENDQPVLEAYDTTGDGSLDAFVTLDANEEVTTMTGDGAVALTRPKVVEFSALLAEGGGGEAAAPEEEEDLVGSLDSITIPGGAGSWLVPVFILAAILAGWWYFKGRKKIEDDD